MFSSQIGKKNYLFQNKMITLIAQTPSVVSTQTIPLTITVQDTKASLNKLSKSQPCVLQYLALHIVHYTDYNIQ